MKENTTESTQRPIRRKKSRTSSNPYSSTSPNFKFYQPKKVTAKKWSNVKSKIRRDAIVAESLSSNKTDDNTNDKSTSNVTDEDDANNNQEIEPQALNDSERNKCINQNEQTTIVNPSQYSLIKVNQLCYKPSDNVVNNKECSDTTYFESTKIISLKKAKKWFKANDPNPDPNTDVNKPVNCFICHKPFNSFKEMQEHYMGNHKSKKKPIYSDITTSASVSPTEITAKTMNDDVQCELCPRLFRNRTWLTRHLKESHFLCSFCNIKFDSFDLLSKHICKFIPNKKNEIKTKVIKSSKASDLPPLTSAIPVTSSLPRYINILPKLTTTTIPTQTLPFPLIFGLKPQNIPIKPPENVTNSQIIGKPNIEHMEITPELPIFSQSPYHKSNMGEHLQLTPDLPILKQAFKNTINSPPQSHIFVGNNIATPPRTGLESAFERIKQSSEDSINRNTAELASKPNVTVTYIPSSKNCKSTITEYSCGRCNVLCNDLEDYLDHINDCLTLSNVTLESITSPAPKLLNLKKCSFKYNESKEIPYIINRKLAQKIKSILNIDVLNENNNSENENLELKDISPIINKSQSSCNENKQKSTTEKLLQKLSLSPNNTFETKDKVLTIKKINKIQPTPLISDPKLNTSFNKTQTSTNIPVNTQLYSNISLNTPSQMYNPIHIIQHHPGVSQLATHYQNHLLSSKKAMVVFPVPTPIHQPHHSQTSTLNDLDQMQPSPPDLLIDEDNIKMEIEDEFITDSY